MSVFASDRDRVVAYIIITLVLNTRNCKYQPLTCCYSIYSVPPRGSCTVHWCATLKYLGRDLIFRLRPVISKLRSRWPDSVKCHYQRTSRHEPTDHPANQGGSHSIV